MSGLIATRQLNQQFEIARIKQISIINNTTDILPNTKRKRKQDESCKLGLMMHQTGRCIERNMSDQLLYESNSGGSLNN